VEFCWFNAGAQHDMKSGSLSEIQNRGAHQSAATVAVGDTRVRAENLAGNVADARDRACATVPAGRPKRRLEHQEVAAKLAARTRYWHRQYNHAEEASSLTLFLALLALHELVSVDFGLRRP